MRTDRFERLWAEHARDLLRFLAYRTENRDTAEDLLVATFERALSARTRFDRRRGSERTWLFSIARNLAHDHARRRAAERRAVDRVGGAAAAEVVGSGGIEPIVERDALMRALAQLPEDEREAIALRYGADMKLEGVASVLGEPRTTVEARVYRGLRRLRDLLG